MWGPQVRQALGSGRFDQVFAAGALFIQPEAAAAAGSTTAPALAGRQRESGQMQGAALRSVGDQRGDLGEQWRARRDSNPPTF